MEKIVLTTFASILLWSFVLAGYTLASPIRDEDSYELRNVVIAHPLRQRMPHHWPEFAQFALKIQRFDTTSGRLFPERVIEGVNFPRTLQLRDGMYYSITTEGVDVHNRRHFVERKIEKHGYEGETPFMTHSTTMYSATPAGFEISLRLSSSHAMNSAATQWKIKHRYATSDVWRIVKVPINETQISLVVPQAGPHEIVSCAVGENGEEGYSLPANIQIYLSPCQSHIPHCFNDGKCRASSSGTSCVCKAGFTGSRCESELDAATKMTHMNQLVVRLNAQIAAQKLEISWLRRHCSISGDGGNNDGSGSGIRPEDADKDGPGYAKVA